MIARRIKKAGLGALCVIAVAIFAAPAQAAPNDPLFLMRPIALFKTLKSPPPTSTLEGPCGLAVDGAGQVYLSDYYHDAIHIFGPNINGDNNSGAEPRYGYRTQIFDTDPYDGPCGVALDAFGGVYVNEYHRSVTKVNSGVITGAPLDNARPTGVAVDPVSERIYVNDRDHIAVFDLAGAPLGTIGMGSLVDGYGLAVSRYKDTLGYIYAADAATNTIKVYAPTLGGIVPAMTINGSETPLGGFVSVTDAGIAVDNATGEVYVSDNLQPRYTEKPEAVIQVFNAAGKYVGRLKYSIIFGQSVGLAVDNSGGLGLTPNEGQQGRVYVTSGNTNNAAVYGYPPHAASDEAFPLPEPKNIEPIDENYDPGGTSGVQSAGVAVASSSAGAVSRSAADSAAVPATAKAGNRAKAKRKAAKRRRAKIARAAR